MLPVIGSAAAMLQRSAMQHCLAAMPRLLHSSIAATEWKHTVPMPPGTTLNIVAKDSSVDITTASGIDTASIKGSQQSMVSSWDLKLQPTTPQPDSRPTVCLTELPGSSGGSLSLTIPDKWVSVDIKAQGGSVHVAKVTEAHLTVSSNGGHVQLGSIRAVNAEVRTRGGELKGTELSATTVVVETKGGSIGLQRLLGQQASVDSAGGSVAVGACYGDDMDLKSGGSPIHIGTMDCSADVRVASQGGAITVDSLDGNAELKSSGGNIQVHLHSKVGDLSVTSGGGDVGIAVCPEAVVSLTVKGEATVLGDGDFVAQGSQRMAHFRPPEPTGRSGSKEPRWGTLSEGSCIIDSQGGKVTVNRLRWADALRARLSNKAK